MSQIKMSPSQGNGTSRLLSLASVAGGVMTGNPMMIAGGTVGLQQANTGKSSPIGQAIGMYNTGSQLAGSMGSTGKSTPETDANVQKPELGSEVNNSSAMDRSLTQKQQDPRFQIKSGMDLVMNTPADQLGIPPKLHEEIFHTLARAYHLGPDQMDNGGYA